MAASQATFVKGPKGSYAILDKEYMFVVNRKEPLQNVQYWRCRRFLKNNKEKSCPASIVMDMDGYVKNTSKALHNHPPDPEGVQATIEAAEAYADSEEERQKKIDKLQEKEERKKNKERKESEERTTKNLPKLLPKKTYQTQKVKEQAAIRLESVLATQELEQGKSFREVAAMLGYTKTLEANLHKEYRPPTPTLPPKKKLKQTQRQQEAEDKKFGTGQNEVLARYVTQMSYDTSKQISESLKNLGIMELTPAQVVGRLHTLGFERIIETNEITGKGVYRWLQSKPSKQEVTATQVVEAVAEQICKKMKPLRPNPFPDGAPKPTRASEVPSRASTLLAAAAPVLPNNPMHFLLPQ